MENHDKQKSSSGTAPIDPQFAAALDNLAEGFKILAPLRDDSGKITDFVYVYVNDAITKIARLKKEDMEGHRMSRVLHGFLDTPLFEACCRTAASGETVIINNAFVKQRVADHEVEGYFNVRVTKFGENIILILHETTETMLKEEALDNSEKGFRQIFENSFDALLLTGPHGNIYKANAAAEKLFGYTEEELCRSGRTAIADPSDPNWEKALSERTDTGKFSGVLRYKRKDGSTFLGEASSVMFRIKDGSYRTSNVVRDITGRLEAEKEILQAKQQLQDIIDGAPALVFAKDLQGRFIIINKRLEELLGMKNEEIKGRTDFDIFPKQWAEYYREHDRRIAQSGKAEQIVEESDLADGAHHTFMANKFPLYNENGEIYAVCGISTDITEMKKTEKALQKMASDLEKYAALFENAKWGIVIGSVDGLKIDLMNKEFAHMHGYTIDELMGRKIEDLFAPEVKHDLQEHLRKVVEKGNHSFESVHICKDGSKFPVEIYSTAVKDNNGNILFRAANIIDISGRKTAEAELNKTLIELERSNRELEQFAYAASHDLQEPLRMITNFTRLLELRTKDKLDEKTKEYMWFISDGARRMSDLIRDLLSYSRITTKASPFQRVDLNSIISEVMRDLQLIIAESDTEIEVDALPELMADRMQMKQLFQNLIQNAIKFRNKLNSRIKVTAENKDGYWQFGVEDNGIGISPAHHERIFMLFQRLHEREKFPGTGIGLALCKKIVEQHGGRIWVESQEGKGSTFYFTISE